MIQFTSLAGVLIEVIISSAVMGRFSNIIFKVLFNSMSPELPRFNQKFINRIEQGSDEHRFVSNVGEVTFLTMSHIRTLKEIQAVLREPLYRIGLDSASSSVERALYFESYGGMFESELDSRGLHEYVVAVNGLKDAIVRLRGRNIEWSDGLRDAEGGLIRYDDHLGDSKIGFYPNSVEVPSLSIGFTSKAHQNGLPVDLEAMWDIEIYPKEY